MRMVVVPKKNILSTNPVRTYSHPPHDYSFSGIVYRHIIPLTKHAAGDNIQKKDEVYVRLLTARQPGDRLTMCIRRILNIERDMCEYPPIRRFATPCFYSCVRFLYLITPPILTRPESRGYRGVVCT